MHRLIGSHRLERVAYPWVAGMPDEAAEIGKTREKSTRLYAIIPGGEPLQMLVAPPRLRREPHAHHRP
jgi:hypothetical protein